MQKVTRLGIFNSSKFTTLRLSAGALRFLGAAGFLKGSAPDSFAHLWHKNPGGGTAAIVYLVWERGKHNVGEMPPKTTYHGELLLALCAVVETSDRWSGGLERILDKGGVGILVVVIVIFMVVILRLLWFGFSPRFQLCFGSFCELPFLWFWGFLWFVQLVGVVPIGRLYERSADKKSAAGGPTNFVILSGAAFRLCLGTSCACCRLIRRPRAASDCRRSYSGFLGQFRHRTPESKSELTRR